MIASLPMYARASNRAAHDTLWVLIRDGLRARDIPAPDRLDHDIDHWDSWGHPDLVLGQICNLPLRSRFAGHVTLIGAADYGLKECPAGFYRSHFVVQRDCVANQPDMLFDARFVLNDTLSQSGYASAQIWAAKHGNAFRAHLKTGSHRASIAAVANGAGDIASIDAQTWRIEEAENPDTSQLKIIGHTDISPGMTFITAKGHDPAPYFAAIREAIQNLDSLTAQKLGLKAIVALPSQAYDLPIPKEPVEIDG
ncbi:phosphate/phosphite/phosphonate ABC transporter substrate-binding protein [Yoonia sp.]|uniref:phosphate/phosphite/phosphonate ABC transporter substrate-binding protein n=1 Tax=Yoonia sp. TaxID=2212373 RepID=UPI0035C7CCCF